jgi:GABA permease
MPDRIPARPEAHSRTPIAPEPRRILIVANQTASSPTMIAELKRRTQHGSPRLHLLVPALSDRVRHWLSDSDAAVDVARRRARDARSTMADHGITVTVEIGDSVPIHAIADTLSRFDADEILISTLPPDRSHWLERDLINDARERFGLPVGHIVAAPEPAMAM